MDQRPSNRHVVCQAQRNITELHWNIYHRFQPQQTWLSEQGTIGTLYLSMSLKTKKKSILLISKSHKMEFLSTQHLFPSVLMNQWKSVWTGRESTTISTFTSSNPQEHMCSTETPLESTVHFQQISRGEDPMGKLIWQSVRAMPTSPETIPSQWTITKENILSMDFSIS